MDRSIAVDAHHHVWELAVRDQPWTTGLAAIHRSFSLEDLTPALLACDVRSTIVVQTLNVVDETPELLDLARRSPVVAGVVGWVDLVGTGVGDDVARLRARPGGEYLKGVRHVAQGEDERWFARPDVLDGAEVSRLHPALELLLRLSNRDLSHPTVECSFDYVAPVFDRRTLEKVIAGIGHGHLDDFVGTV